MDDHEFWGNPTLSVYEEQPLRASPVLDSNGQPYWLEIKKQPLGFNLTKRKTYA
tara:strand:- start:4474 stop:4635 length:162 start_codon:yes stop_codon:yes gene_type:complete